MTALEQGVLTMSLPVYPDLALFGLRVGLFLVFVYEGWTKLPHLKEPVQELPGGDSHGLGHRGRGVFRVARHHHWDTGTMGSLGAGLAHGRCDVNVIPEYTEWLARQLQENNLVHDIMYFDDLDHHFRVNGQHVESSRLALDKIATWISEHLQSLSRV